MQEHYDEFFEVSGTPGRRAGGRAGRPHPGPSRGDGDRPVSPQEVFTEMEEKYGEVEEMNVCDNLGDHLVGNVYVKVGGGSAGRDPPPHVAAVGAPVPPPASLRGGRRRLCPELRLQLQVDPWPRNLHVPQVPPGKGKGWE